MAFEPGDFDELIRYLDAHPDVRVQLRRRILSDDFLRLPIEVAELRDAVLGLGVGLDRLAGEVQNLAVEMKGLTAQNTELAESVKALGVNVAEYVGPTYELLFRQKGPSLFGEWVRRPRLVELDEVPGVEQLEISGGFTAQELRRLRALDMVIGGVERVPHSTAPLFLAVEVSRTIDLEDVDRAIERAGLLARGGAQTRAAVAGKIITSRALRRAEETATLVRLLDDVA
jgi:hypothetical protein